MTTGSHDPTAPTRGRGARRVLRSAATIAAVVLLAHAHGRPGRPSLTLDVEVRALTPSVGPRRTIAAIVGDEITIRAHGAQAIWVYRDTTLIERCPGAPACEPARGFVGLQLTLRVPGRVRILAITGGTAIEPLGSFDADVLAARARGGRLELRVVDARPAP